MGKNETADSDASKETKNQSKVEIPQLHELQRLISEPGLSPSELCIYKVPRKLRAINPAAYTPQMISIGPFHLNGDGLKVMQKQKLKYLVGFCTRTGKKDSLDLVDKIRKLEERIRHCYEDSTTDEISKEDFANMILLDSVFIIELFLRRGEKYNFFGNGNNDKYKEDYILGKSTREYGLLEDLILVENQLPYFVLEDLYDLTVGKLNEGGYPPFSNLMVKNLRDYLSPPQIDEEHKKCSCDCFSCFYCFWIPRCFSRSKLNDQRVKGEEEEEEDDYLEYKPLNFTDLIRKRRCYKRPKSNNNNGNWVKNLYRATRLHEAGVKFKVCPEAWPINMKFKRGKLRMPLFIVDDNTERLIRNLMAFEQCHYPNDPFICDYIWILDF